MDELAAIVRRSRSLRVLGSRHSFSDIADTTGDLVSGPHASPVRPRPEARTLTVDGGVRHGDLCRTLDGRLRPPQPRLAAPHLGRRRPRDRHPRVGDRSGNPRPRVRAIEVVAADGEAVRSAPDGDDRSRWCRRVLSAASGVVTASPWPSSGVSHAAGPVRGPAARRGRRALRRDHGERRQRQPFHGVAGPDLRAGVVQAPGGRRCALHARAGGLRSDAGHDTDPSHPPPASRCLYGAARRGRVVVRAAAALPDGPHAERGRRAPERVPRPPPRRRGSSRSSASEDDLASLSRSRRSGR